MREICGLDEPLVGKESEGYLLVEVVSYVGTDWFRVELLKVNNNYTIDELVGCHRMTIITRVNAALEFDDRKKVAPQGRGVFFPANIRDLKITSQNETIEVVISYPSKMSFNPERVFYNPIHISILVDIFDAYLENLEAILGIGPWRIAKFPPVGNEDVYREYHRETANFKGKFCLLKRNMTSKYLVCLRTFIIEAVWEPIRFL